jgi:uncharacterized Tic20 family protein
MYSDRNLIQWAERLQEASVYSALMTGFLMSCIRLIDPYIIFLFKKEFSSWFGVVVRENRNDNDSLTSHLISGVTIELVTVILRVITKDESLPKDASNQPHVHGE